jgi:hypothetical protein
VIHFGSSAFPLTGSVHAGCRKTIQGLSSRDAFSAAVAVVVVDNGWSGFLNGRMRFT